MVRRGRRDSSTQPYGGIYRIIDRETGETYIGQHCFRPSEYMDGKVGWRQYLSSSVVINRLLDEDGVDSSRFVKQHVEWCWSSAEMADEEIRLIRLEKQTGHGELNRLLERIDYKERFYKSKWLGKTWSDAKINAYKPIVDRIGGQLVQSYVDDPVVTVRGLAAVLAGEAGRSIRSALPVARALLVSNGVHIRKMNEEGHLSTRASNEKRSEALKARRRVEARSRKCVACGHEFTGEWRTWDETWGSEVCPQCRREQAIPRLKNKGIPRAGLGWAVCKALDAMEADDLKRLYVDEGLPPSRIAPLLGVSHCTVPKVLELIGVEVRDRSAAALKHVEMDRLATAEETR